MIDRLLQLCASLSIRMPYMIVLIGIGFAVVSVVYTTMYLELNADPDDLIARDQPFMDEYLAFLDEFGDLEFLYVVIERGDDVQRTEACVRFLGERLKEIELLPDVFYKIEPAEQLRIATRAMPDEELRELALISDAFASLLTADDVPQRLFADARQHLRELTRPFGRMEPVEQERRGAAAIFELQVLASALPDSHSGRELAWLLSDELRPQYLQSDSGRFYFVMIMPVKDYGTMSVIAEPLRDIRSIIDEARDAFPELEIGLTGKPVLQHDEMATTERDMKRASILAIILVSLLFMVVIGGVRHPIMAVGALLFGIAWTFGLTTFFVGQLNLLSIVFTLVLVGVGIDFGIHIVSRYKEEIRHNSVEDSIRIALRTAGRGNVTGALTSSIAFYMALFTEFQGLRELGFIAGTGLLLCLVAMLIVLPALLVIFDRRRESRGIAPPTLTGKTAFEDRLWAVLIHHPSTVIGLALAVSILLAPFLWRISFQENLLELQAEGLESIEWEHRLMQDSAETWFGAVIVESPQRVLEVIDEALDYPIIASTGSIFDVIRPETEERVAWRTALHQHLAVKPSEPDRIERGNIAEVLTMIRTMATAAERMELEEASLLRNLAQDIERIEEQLHDPDDAAALRESMAANAAKAATSIELILQGDRADLREALPRAMRDRFVSARGNFLVKLHPAENVWEIEPMEEFVSAMRAIDPDATGVPITQYESLLEMQRAFILAASLAFIAVFILLLLDLRSLRDSVIAILPLVIGMLWLVELMGATGVQFNLANFFAVPILIGIGVDSGIHIVRRYREGGPNRLMLGSTRRAVAMTSLTSMIGFGALITASHRGVFSLGLVMAMGAASCLIASLIVLPAILAWFDRRITERRYLNMISDGHD